MLDSLNEIKKAKEISDIENNHVIEIHEKELEAHRTQLYWIWGALSLFVIMTAGIVVLVHDRKRKIEKLKYEQELKDIKRRYILQNAIEEETDNDETELPKEKRDTPEEVLIESSEKEQRVSHLSIQQERIVLCRAYYEASEWIYYFRKHYSEVKAQQSFMPVAETEKFARFIGDLFLDIHVDMMKENPRLTQQDLEYCSLVILGLKANQIAFFTRSTLQSCYNRRNRLKERLSTDWYWLVFEKPALK